MVLLVAAVTLLAVVIVYLMRRPAAERDLNGKVVLLTGAGGGFGRAMALLLARRGCRIACVDVVPAPNEETVSLLQQQQQHHDKARPGPVAKGYIADLCRSEDITTLVERVIEDFGHVDILVSNAGQVQNGALWEMSEAQIDRVLDVNLRATMLLARLLVPHMRGRRTGHIVAVSSLAALVPGRKGAVYAPSKAGLSQLMECLYHDLQGEGLHKAIPVTTIQPYFMSTFGALNEFVNFRGPVAKAMCKFVNPATAAELAVSGIASGQHVVTIPPGMVFTAHIIRLMPRAFLTFCNQYVLPVDVGPTFPYEYRHKVMDAGMMYDLLNRGFTLEQDPEPVCRELLGKHAAKDWPHDFARFSGSIESFYKARREAVPDAVRSVFDL